MFHLLLLFACAVQLTLINSISTLPQPTTLEYTASSIKSLQGSVNIKGIESPTLKYSAGHKATCFEGFLRVPVEATNREIFYDGPKDNYELTALLTDFFQINTNTTERLVGGDADISDTFTIFSRLCLPSTQTETETKSILFLTHGGTTDIDYWDFAPGYCFLDAAAERGYATFSFDRLGTGRSQHPDPIQVVQQALQIELAHTLVTWLKSGNIGATSFENVIGVGHSLGSALTQGVSAIYPDDFSALILTGHSAFLPGSSIGIASTAQQIANTEPSGRYAALPNGYITEASVLQSVLFGFYYYPHFDKQIVQKAFDTRQTNALGELLTIGAAYAPATHFTKPVYILNGQQDFFFCQGNCLVPQDIPAQALPIFFPAAAANSLTEAVPNIGHNINLHYGAPAVFDKMLDFLSTRGISP